MQEFIKKHKRFLILLAPALIGSIYLVLCFINLQNSIWFDESYSAYLIRFSPKEMLDFTAVDVHPPLYYFLLKLWSAVFGYSDFTLRAMSAVFGAIAILFAFLWFKYKFGNRAALLASLFLAFSPSLVRYGQEMRMYTLVIAIVFAASYILEIAITSKEKKWWLCYAVLVALGMYTHYFSAFAWIAQLIYIIYTYKKDFFKKKIYLVFAISVALYIPWLPFFLKQSSAVQANGFWIAPVSIAKVANYFSESFLYRSASEVSAWLLIIFTLALGCFIALSIRYAKKMKLLLMLCVLPVVELIVCSLPPLRSMFVPRYVLYSACLISAIMGLELSFAYQEIKDKLAKIKSKKRAKAKRKYNLALVALSIIFVLTTGLGLQSVYAKDNFNFETGSQSRIKEIREELLAVDAGRNLAIVAFDQWSYYDLSFYSDNEHPVYFFGEKTDYPYGSFLPLKESHFEDFGKIESFEEFSKEHKQFWYLTQSPKGEEVAAPFENLRVVESLESAIDDHSGKFYKIFLYEVED